MRSKWYFLMVGLAMVLGPSLANSQFGPLGGGGGFPGGGGGFPGGGAGGFGGGRGNRGGGGGGMGGMSFDPTQMWNMMAPGKEVVTQADAASNPMLGRMFDRAVQTLGITNGQLTRDQFTQYMQQRTAQRGNPGGPITPGGSPGAPGMAMPNGFAQGAPGGQGGFGRGNNNQWGGNNQWAGNNQWGGQNQWGGNNQWGAGGGGGGSFDPDQMAEMRFRRLDLDGDGLLSYDEMASDPALQSEKDRWDSNNDGFIDLGEFKEYFKARLAQFTMNGQNWQGGLNGNGQDDRRTTVYRIGKYPPGLPAWFSQYDTDLDGQVGLYEWKAAGQPLDRFEKMDTNGDGFLTVEEVLKATGVAVASANGGSPGSPGMFGMMPGGRGNGAGRGNRGMGGGGNPFGGGGGNPFGGGGGGRGGRGGRGGGGGGAFGGGGGNPFGGGGGFPGADPNAQGGGRGRGGFGGGAGGFPGGGAQGTDPNAQGGGGRGRGGFGGGAGGFPGAGGAPQGATDPNAQGGGRQRGGRGGRGGGGGGFPGGGN